jgi:hypothetical protein
MSAVRVPSPPLNYDYSVVTSDTNQAATLLLDAKNEYHKQLTSHLRQPVFNLMKSIYNLSEDICHQENTPENILMVFQDNLAQVPKWTKQRRAKEYDDFLKVSKCDWFNELIKFTYVTHVKILTIVNKPRPDVKLSISIPSGGVFYHSVCISVARELWRSPFLFSKHVGGKYEYQKNMRQVEQIIDNSVDTCIRAHIPMKTILQEYLDGDLTISPPASSKFSQPEPANPIQEPETIKEPTHHEPSATTLLTPTSTSRNKKLEIKTNDSLDEFINTPAGSETSKEQPLPIAGSETSKEQPLPNNSATSADDTNLQEDDLESVSFARPDEMVDELDIIETAIEDKDLDAPGDEITDLPEVVLSQQPSTATTPEPTPTTNPTTPIPEPTPTTNPTTPIPEPIPADENIKLGQATKATKATKANIIEEFDIDTLPELNLESLTRIAAPNKPTTPIPAEEQPSVAENTKYIPLTDMNEPGINIREELKQPTAAKKKLIIEDVDLLTDELDEVPLQAKAEELRTLRRPDNQPSKPMPVINKQNFAFF